MKDNRELLCRVRNGGAEAESELVENNMGLVRTVALRFLYTGVDYDDLCQIGSIGLLKAIRHFDFERGVMFSTYAVPVIVGEIRKFLRDDGPVKVSRTVREQYARIRRESQRFEQENERTPTLGELCELTGFSCEDVLTALDAGGTPVSLDEPLGDDGDGALGERLCSEDALSDTDTVALKQSLETLSARDRQIIVLRYFESKTQQEVATRLGMTQVQVSRREKKILQTLRSMLE